MENTKTYEEMDSFINECLTRLNKLENKVEVRLILEDLYSDVMIEDIPPAVMVANKLNDIGESEIVKTYIYPLIADLNAEK